MGNTSKVVDIVPINASETNQTQSVSKDINKGEVQTVYDVTSCGFQMEKLKLPKFSGDGREYAIFRSDFIHAIESRYTNRDSITLLRTCLKETRAHKRDWV